MVALQVTGFKCKRYKFQKHRQVVCNVCSNKFNFKGQLQHLSFFLEEIIFSSECLVQYKMFCASTHRQCLILCTQYLHKFKSKMSKQMVQKYCSNSVWKHKEKNHVTLSFYKIITEQAQENQL